MIRLVFVRPYPKDIARRLFGQGQPAARRNGFSGTGALAQAFFAVWRNHGCADFFCTNSRVRILASIRCRFLQAKRGGSAECLPKPFRCGSAAGRHDPPNDKTWSWRRELSPDAPKARNVEVNAMKRLISAALALTLLGTTAAVADPWGRHGRGGHYGHGYRHGGNNGAGLAIGLGIGLFALAAIAASQHNDRYDDRYAYDRGYGPGYGGYRGGYNDYRGGYRGY
jgi:hypothetical protein